MKGITCQGLVKRADASKLLYLESTINIFIIHISICDTKFYIYLYKLLIIRDLLNS